MTTGTIDGQKAEAGKELVNVAVWLGKDIEEQPDDTV